jgi:diguanylate cyclase (GGDEF)-like protein
MTTHRTTVLIVDDNPHNLQVLAEVVGSEACDCVLATTAAQALAFVAAERPDLILLDVMMPDMDGYQVCGQIKADSLLREVPIIFLTAKTEPADILQGFDAGAVDYVVKPFNAAELRARVRTHLELKRAHDRLAAVNAELVHANQLIQQRNAQLTEATTALELASSVDPLTGLLNRRSMLQRLEKEVARSRRTQRVFSLLLGDLDYFKEVNDQHGHDCGDTVLARVSERLGAGLRAIDAVARWGGEEFLVLLSETGLEGALGVAERIRLRIALAPIPHGTVSVAITMTLGVAAHHPEAPIEETIRCADRALYDGKQRGRNCVVAS